MEVTAPRRMDTGGYESFVLVVSNVFEFNAIDALTVEEVLHNDDILAITRVKHLLWKSRVVMSRDEKATASSLVGCIAKVDGSCRQVPCSAVCTVLVNGARVRGR